MTKKLVSRIQLHRATEELAEEEMEAELVFRENEVVLEGVLVRG